jgi:hypothetical protein
MFFASSSSAGSATITNNPALVANIGNLYAAGHTLFANTSTAGSATITNNGGTVSNGSGGATVFINTSSAGSATITNTSATVDTVGGITDFAAEGSSAGSATITNDGGTVIGRDAGFVVGSTFFNLAHAGSATITNNGGTVSGASGGFTRLTQSSGGSATFINNGGAVSGAAGGFTNFDVSAGAGNATLIANGGVSGIGGGAIQLFGDSTGDTARVEVFGNGTGDTTNGNLDISLHNAPSVTIGSVEGTGNVFLGAFNLTVGSNNLSKTFSGVIQDGGIGAGTGGSLTKIGTGKLTLSKASTYTGGTTLTKGTLLVTNRTGSATGTGPVQVSTGTLEGTGIITGAVTAGTGRSSGAILLPGKSATAPGILTINSALTFNSRSTYKCVLNRRTPIAGEITALGVTINSGASFSFVDVGTGTLTVGTVFTLIKNTSANPISGTFSNLANGSIFNSNGNNLQASYTGGTGNDLTLTVVP